MQMMASVALCRQASRIYGSINWIDDGCVVPQDCWFHNPLPNFSRNGLLDRATQYFSREYHKTRM